MAWGSAGAQAADLQASYDFLVRERADGGALVSFPTGTGNTLLPASYYDTADYWGAYVCQGVRALCGVTNTYNEQSHELLPPPGAAGKLQVERVNAHNGANIYDAATWQIAVVLGFVKGKLRLPSPVSAYALASGPTQMLHRSGRPVSCTNQAACEIAPGAQRAVTTGQTFVYNGTAVSESHRAYAFRAMAPEWLARDPLMGSPYGSFITASNLPPSNRDYQAGRISWSDWKPITGENAWAFLIGPLHAAYIHYVDFQKRPFIPFSELAVQNAVDMLPTFAAMQSALGGVHYAPQGTAGNEGGAVHPHEVSVENNFSLYAGLRILRATLLAQSDKDPAVDSAAKSKIAAALKLIDTMIEGGDLDADRKTKGLLSFFRNATWQNGVFVQGGLANDPARAEWVPATGTQAVDVQTWGIAALGAKTIDAWFGYGASFDLWQHTKMWGAYGVGSELWGVGYSNHDGNGIDEKGDYKQGVMSAEWTAGAITAVRNMIAAYGAEPKYLASLKRDEAAMLAAMNALRVDRYAETGFPGKPPTYGKLVPMETKPYLYASRRYHIPFGWYANPLPSTASTAWMIMVANSYDPFGFAGRPN